MSWPRAVFGIDRPAARRLRREVLSCRWTMATWSQVRPAQVQDIWRWLQMRWLAARVGCALLMLLALGCGVAGFFLGTAFLVAAGVAGQAAVALLVLGYPHECLQRLQPLASRQALAYEALGLMVHERARQYRDAVLARGRELLVGDIDCLRQVCGTEGGQLQELQLRLHARNGLPAGA